MPVASTLCNSRFTEDTMLPAWAVSSHICLRAHETYVQTHGPIQTELKNLVLFSPETLSEPLVCGGLCISETSFASCIAVLSPGPFSSLPSILG